MIIDFMYEENRSGELVGNKFVGVFYKICSIAFQNKQKKD